MADFPFHRSDRPLVWAHRGASHDAPENTLDAFTLAAEQRADGIELDAQRCGTGEVVCFHDETLARTTGHVGLLAETPWSTLQRLDASRVRPARPGARVPLLADVFASTPASLLVNVELKCERPDDRGLTAEVVRIIRDANASERVLLSSFNPLCLARARRLAPDLPRALLFHEEAALPLRHPFCAPALDVAALHPQHTLATPRAVQRWVERGYTVACWTVDDPEQAAALVQSGVTGLITNVPGVMLARFART